MYGVGSVPQFHYYHAVLFPIGVLVPFIWMVMWIPETPRWLLLYLKDKQRAIAAMKYLNGPGSPVEKHLQKIQLAAEFQNVPLRKTLHKLFFQKDILIPFVVALFVVVLQQLCGVGPVIGYASQTLYKAGSPNPDLTALLAGLILLPSTIVAGVLVEIVGRRILLGVSTFGMFVSQAVLGFHFFITRPSFCAPSNSSDILELGEEEGCFPNLYPLAIVGVALFAFFFATGVGPVSWIVFTEYLPLEVKGVASGIVLSANRATGILLLGTFSNYSRWAGDWTAWWTLSSFNLISFVCVLLFVVETKGRTLEEVPELFRKHFKFCFWTSI